MMPAFSFFYGGAGVDAYVCSIIGQETKMLCCHLKTLQYRNMLIFALLFSVIISVL